VVGLQFDGYTKKVERSGSVIIVSLQKAASNH